MSLNIFQVRWWAFDRRSRVSVPDQLVQSAIAPQSIPPLSVVGVNPSFAVTSGVIGLQVFAGMPPLVIVTGLTNPILNH